jgi:uncharacterized protein (DUF427 family)
MKAIWNGKVIAESNQTINVEGNHYFPPESVNNEHLIDSDTRTICHWKGTASYYHLNVNGKINENAAWYYPNPSKLADKIKDYIAFWKGIDIIK